MAGDETMEGGAVLAVEAAIGRLRESRNPCDARKAVDLAELAGQAGPGGPWRGRFSLKGVAAGPRRTLAVVCGIRVRSLAWDGEPKPWKDWTFVLMLFPEYPLEMPAVRFAPPLPFNPHALHPAHMPIAAQLPPELAGYIREGAVGGQMCWLQARQWSPVRSSLALAVWQIGRILSGSVHCEGNSLNPRARDVFLQMRSGHGPRFDLGPPLPFPLLGPAGPDAAGPEPADSDIEWLEDGGPEVR